MQILRQHPPDGLGQGDLFGGQGPEGGGDMPASLGDREHQAASKLPDLPPLLAVRRMSVTVMPRSTALHMS